MLPQIQGADRRRRLRPPVPQQSASAGLEK